MGLSGIIPGNTLEVNASFGEKLCLRMSPLENVGLWVPESVEASSPEELENIMAAAFYTDGSTAPKRVRWDKMCIRDRYYLYYVLDKKSCVSVAVCDAPAGKYEFYGYVHYEDGSRLGEREGDEPQFDPAVITEGGCT